MAGKRRKVAKPRGLDEQGRGERQQSRSSEPAAATTGQQAHLSEAARRDGPAENARGAEKPADHSSDRTNALEALIEEERIHLLQVFGMLKCLYEVLLYADDDDSTMHADVVHVCATLVNECVVRLEGIAKRYQAGEFRESPKTPTLDQDADKSPTTLNRTHEDAEDE